MFFFYGAKLIRDCNPFSYCDLVSLSLNQFARVSQIYINTTKCATRYYPTTSLFIKSTDEGYLSPSDFESFIARNVSSIHLRGRGGV